MLALARKGCAELAGAAAPGARARLSMARHFAGGRLVIASHNPGKLREIAELLAPLRPIASRRPSSACPSPKRPATTFAGNAELKALAAARGAGLPALADDSGLAVDALGGAPGSLSPRAGPGRAKDFAMAMQRVERQLGAAMPTGAPISSAVLALAWPDGHVELFEGKVDGRLVWPPRGDARLRLRPDLPARGRSRDLRRDGPRGKHAISHRAAAFRLLIAACFRSERRHMRRVDQDPGFALYVHWPFCKSKCPYCDFNSHVRERIDQARWRRALLAELDHYAALTPGRRVTSIFFGGGTPSLMEPTTVGAVIEQAARRWAMDSDVEITLEANPTSVEAANFAALAAAGVNRVSLGVQALDDAALQIPRPRAYVPKRRSRPGAGPPAFPALRFDLIYARPGQTEADWAAELEQALGLAGEHLSVYQLTIEREHGLRRRMARGDFTLPEEEQRPGSSR